MFGRRQAAIVVAEFLGTGVLALVMLSVQHSTIGLPYFVALIAGLALAVMIAVFGGADGVHFNPAITIGMWTARQIKTLPAVAYVIAQLLGAWAVFYLYTYFAKTSLQPIGGHYDGHILVAEAVGGLILSLAFASAVFNKFWNAKLAGTVGAAYVLAIVAASTASIGIVNPAVAVSMRAFDMFGSMGWGTYALGPVLGAIIGFNLYALLFAPESALVKAKSLASERLGHASAVSAEAGHVSSEKEATKPAAKRSSKVSAKAKKTKK